MQQQTTINIPAGHPVRAMTGLARQIALPGEFAPERFPSFPALERTAVMGFSQPASMTLPAATDVKLMLARQASYPAWGDVGLLNGTSWSACWQTADPGNSQLTGSAPVIPKLSTWLSGSGGGTSLGIQTVTGATKTFPYAILGVDAGCGPCPFIWVPAGFSALYILAGGSGTTYQTSPVGGANVTVNFEVWASPGEVVGYPANGIIVAAQVGCTLAFPTGAPTAGAWIRPSYVTYNTANVADYTGFRISIVVAAGSLSYTAGGGPGSVAVVGAATTAFVPIVVPSEFATSRLPWSATRVTAVSLLGTNVTQVLNKAGTVLAGRINPTLVDPFRATTAAVATLHPAEKAWMPLETGLYTYCPPSTDMTDFWDYTMTQVSGSEAITTPDAPVYRLDNAALVNMLFCKAGGVDEALALTVSWHLEFRTSSALFQIALSGMLIETLHQAQLALASAGFFFHNPDHKAVLNRVIQAVHKVVPSALLPASRPKAQSARVVAVPQARVSMPATSAGASGITQASRKKSKGKTKRAAKPAAKQGKRR